MLNWRIVLPGRRHIMTDCFLCALEAHFLTYLKWWVTKVMGNNEVSYPANVSSVDLPLTPFLYVCMLVYLQRRQ